LKQFCVFTTKNILPIEDKILTQIIEVKLCEKIRHDQNHLQKHFIQNTETLY